MTKQSLPIDVKTEKKNEIKALGFIIFILFPALTIAGVGSYGLVVWMFQAFGGVIAH